MLPWVLTGVLPQGQGHAELVEGRDVVLGEGGVLPCGEEGKLHDLCGASFKLSEKFAFISTNWHNTKACKVR